MIDCTSQGWISRAGGAGSASPSVRTDSGSSSTPGTEIPAGISPATTTTSSAPRVSAVRARSWLST